MIGAIVWKYRTGCPWRELPVEFGSWQSAYTRLRCWAIDGTWQRVFEALVAKADDGADLDWIVAVDSTIVKVHQHAAGARKMGH